MISRAAFVIIVRLTANEASMVRYVTLMKFTAEGARTIKESPARLQANIERMRKIGAKMISATYTQGQYDLVCVSEWPDEETATAFALMLTTSGFVTVETLRAFSTDEMQAIVKKMP